MGGRPTSSSRLRSPWVRRQLVNYRVAGRYYVVDRLFGVAELRLGGKKQQIVRITAAQPKSRQRKAGRGA